MTKKVLMPAGDCMEGYEVMVPFQALESLGVNVDVICPEAKKGDTIATAIQDFTGCQTYVEMRGHNFIIRKTFDEVDVVEYQGLYICLKQKVLEFTRRFFNHNLPVAAICHEIQVLVAAGVTESRALTSYLALSPDVIATGGKYKEVLPTETVKDGSLITSSA